MIKNAISAGYRSWKSISRRNLDQNFAQFLTPILTGYFLPHFNFIYEKIFYLIKFKWGSRNLFKVPKLPIKNIILKLRKIIKVILFIHNELYRKKFSVNKIGDYWVNKNCFFFHKMAKKSDGKYLLSSIWQWSLLFLTLISRKFSLGRIICVKSWK